MSVDEPTACLSACYHAGMGQITFRTSDERSEQIKSSATAAGTSMNDYINTVMGAAVDPDLHTDEVDRIRARLARAGLLGAAVTARPVTHPSTELLDAARAAAGQGTPLSDLVSEGRGPR